MVVCNNEDCSSYDYGRSRNCVAATCDSYIRQCIVSICHHVSNMTKPEAPQPELKIKAEIVSEEIHDLVPGRETQDGKHMPARNVKCKKFGLKINGEIVTWFSSIDSSNYMHLKTHKAKLALYTKIVEKLNYEPERNRVRPTLQLNGRKSNTIEETEKPKETRLMRIDAIALDMRHEGSWVIYEDDHNHVRGRIKSWNNTVVWVVFNCSDDWDNYIDHTAQSCKPENLHFTDAPVKVVGGIPIEGTFDATIPM